MFPKEETSHFNEEKNRAGKSRIWRNDSKEETENYHRKSGHKLSKLYQCYSSTPEKQQFARRAHLCNGLQEKHIYVMDCMNFSFQLTKKTMCAGSNSSMIQSYSTQNAG